jgi:hypothetical protein
VKRQTITRLAIPSMAESMPKPIKAMEPAMIPAVIAMAPSAPIQTRLSHERVLARRAARSQSRLATGRSSTGGDGSAESAVSLIPESLIATR